MSTIYLIRHGQAGFAQAEYDVLSELGATQARKLGSYCVAAALGIDTLYTAPRRRHRETVEQMRAGAIESGGALPEPLSAPAFDEFPFMDIVREACTSRLAAEYSTLTAELEGRDPFRDSRAFSRLFHLSMHSWATGAFSATESFPLFTERVLGGLRRVMAVEGRGRRLAVVTSAGAIAAVLMHVLELSPEMMLKLCLSLRNTGISELRCRGDEVSVISFNASPHLLQPEHLTYR